MKYIIEDGKNTIVIRANSKVAKLTVDTTRISIFQVLQVLAENSVEPCHAQNVYDDLLNR